MHRKKRRRAAQRNIKSSIKEDFKNGTQLERDNNLVRKIAKILLGDTLPNGEPVSSLVLIDAASRAELQRWADMSDAEFEAARQSGDTIHIDVDDEIKRITEEYGLDPNFLDDLLAEFDEDADDDMEIFSDAESEIDQDLLAEIEEWKQQEHDERRDITSPILTRI